MDLGFNIIQQDNPDIFDEQVSLVSFLKAVEDNENLSYNEMKKSEVKEVAYLTPFERIAMEKGMLRKARESVQDVLEEKFGMVPENIQQKLQEIPDNEILRNLHRQAIKASSLEEFSKSLQI